jgi:hypothetical protein
VRCARVKRKASWGVGGRAMRLARSPGARRTFVGLAIQCFIFLCRPQGYTCCTLKLSSCRPICPRSSRSPARRCPSSIDPPFLPYVSMRSSWSHDRPSLSKVPSLAPSWYLAFSAIICSASIFRCACSLTLASFFAPFGLKLRCERFTFDIFSPIHAPAS